MVRICRISGCANRSTSLSFATLGPVRLLGGGGPRPPPSPKLYRTTYVLHFHSNNHEGLLDIRYHVPTGSTGNEAGGERWFRERCEFPNRCVKPIPFRRFHPRVSAFPSTPRSWVRDTIPEPHSFQFYSLFLFSLYPDDVGAKLNFRFLGTNILISDLLCG